jgi:hypothetical protein
LLLQEVIPVEASLVQLLPRTKVQESNKPFDSCPTWLRPKPNAVAGEGSGTWTG